MKKVLSVALAVAMMFALGAGLMGCTLTHRVTTTTRVAVGDIVQFGPYEWRVLSLDEGHAMLITEYIVAVGRYHNTVEDVTWKTSDIRAWLNGEFLERFDAASRSRIARVYVYNPGNPWYGTPGGNETLDQVFLPSIEEVHILAQDEDRVAFINDRALLEQFANDNYERFGMTVDEVLADFGGNWPMPAFWWMRSPGDSLNSAALVSPTGEPNYFAYITYSHGLRPVLWVPADIFNVTHEVTRVIV
ncbi:MAG: DUF6273 domain-containing protein [Oscillospiraceae bacterium]|nr:DUF6273 domain-containing protein [Oscillospiraceae bacterium]